MFQAYKAYLVLLGFCFLGFGYSAQSAINPASVTTSLWAGKPSTVKEPSGVSKTEKYKVKVTPDVKYGEGLKHSSWNSDDGKPMDLLLDVYQPEEAIGPRPVMVFIHGGSFIEGSRKAESAVNLSRYFAARGFVCFAISYRLRDDYGTMPQKYYDYVSGLGLHDLRQDQGLTMYAAGRDAKAAVRWVRANAKTYNLDVNRITAAGGSAGALAAVALGMGNPEDFTDELTQKEDPTLATTNLDQDASVHTVINYWGSINMIGALSAAYGYADRFDPTDRPLAIIHGTADPMITYKHALELKGAYSATGAHYELYPLEDEGHSPWSAQYNGKSMHELAFDFIVRMQEIPVSRGD